MESLAAQIKAHNRAATICNELAPQLVELFTSLKPSDRVTKVDGGFRKHIQDRIDVILGTRARCRSMVSTGHNQVVLDVQCWEPDSNNIAQYKRAAAYIAQLSGDQVAKVYRFDPIPADLDADKIIELRMAVRLAKAEIDRLQSRLGSFAEEVY